MKRIDGQRIYKKTVVKFRSSDWKDTERLLKNIDKELKPYGLEILVIDNYDDQYRIRIDKR